MSYTRYFFQILLGTLLLFRTSLAQTTCLPLYGSDANHPNGLLIQMAPTKVYSGARQNASPTYIQQFSNAGQAVWDATQGPHILYGKAVLAAVSSEISGCVPTPVNAPVKPPQPVPFVNTPLATGSHILVVADFNRDGLNDLAVVAPGSNQISIYIGNSDGTFQAPMNTVLGNASTKLTSIGLADFNNDRKVDIAVVDTVNNAVYVIFGHGDGTFFGKNDGSFAPVTLAVGKTPLALTITDINLDGNADIAVANSADNTVSMIRGNGDGTFVPASVLAVGKNPVSVIAQDMTGDGNLDLVVADNGSNDLAVIAGLGNGGFQNAVFYKTSAPPTYIASADFNNDGFPDVVALASDMNAVMVFNGAFQGKLILAGTFLAPNLAGSFSVNDFDGDGNLDVLVADTDSGSAVLLLGRGDGTLNAPPVYAGSNGFTSMASGDFNNDGNVDLIMTGANSTTSSLSLLSGLGTGQFQSAVNIPVTGRTDVVAVGDFNKDGRLDIAVSGAQLNILMGQANGQFQQAAQYANLTPSVVADFNKDGRLDIAGPFNGGLGVMIGNGDGTFRPATSLNVGSNPKTAVAADLNRDGSIDLLVLNAGTAGSSADPGGISVLIGNGTGSFAAATNIATGFNPRALAVADLNGDGKPDLIVATGIAATGANASSFQISVFLGNGDGSFQTPAGVPVPAGETPNSITVLDLDGDGSQDIVLGNCCSDTATVYFRGNGDGSFQPPTPFNGGNNVRAILVGDWNGDGKPDLALAYSPATSTTAAGLTLLNNRLSNVQTLTLTSGASFLPGPMAPDSIESAFGTNLANTTATASGDASALPTTLAGTSVAIVDSKGVSRQAQLYYVSPTQVNFLVPAATALGMTRVSIAGPNGTVAVQANVISTAPGIFTLSGGLAAAVGVRVSGSTQSTFNLSYTDPVTGFISAVPIFLGTKNDQVFLTLYGTGIRNRASLDGVSVSIGGVYTPALYAGPQSEFPGLDQVNVQIPFVLSGMGKVTIQVTVNGVPANPAFVSIQ